MALDRLEAMRAFCRIVEVGSFNAAAQSLGVAKTTISGQVQALEALLGIKLLHRTTRKVSPTTEGAAYYARARTVIDEVDELEASVSHSRNMVHGRVRIEMPSPVGVLCVVPGLGDFIARFPQIHLDIGCSERAVDLVQEGVDCAIRGGVIADQDLVCRPIGRMRFSLCAAPAYLEGAGVLRTPADLATHKHFGFKFPATGRRYVPTLTSGEVRFDLDLPPFLYFNNGGATAAALLAGLGIGFLPTAHARPYLRSGTLIEVLPDWQMASMPLSIVYPQTRHLSARVRAFTDWVAALMANDPLWTL